MSGKRIGFVSTRLAGTDGVSLETAKLTVILERLGCQSWYCAGELDPVRGAVPAGGVDPVQGITPRVVAGVLIPEMHFDHPAVKAIHDSAFGTQVSRSELHAQISDLANYLKKQLSQFVSEYQIDMLFVQNALAIPMHIPLGVALTDFIGETDIPALAHNHDLYWERERFCINGIPEILERCFPPVLPSLRHIVINSLAQRELMSRRGLSSTVLPNLFDFAHAPPGIDTFNRDLRRELGLSDAHLFVLQPTRVVPRKGIELAIEWVRRLREPRNLARLGKEPVLVITHPAGDEGLDYLRKIQREAEKVGVPLHYAAERFAPQRSVKDGQKIFSLWDAYIHADFVTYPSLLEGFGNALLETIYFRLPALVNRYEVYAKDIAPLGFDLIEVDGEITPLAVEKSFQTLTDPLRHRQMVEGNFALARQHFSYEGVIPLLEAFIGD